MDILVLGGRLNWTILFQNPAVSNLSETSITFTDTGINSNIIDVLEELEITEPTVIQVCLLVLAEMVEILVETEMQVLHLYAQIWTPCVHVMIEI